MITTTLEFNASCKQPFALKGILSVTKNGANAILNYGNGDYNTLVNVTKDGISTKIDFKK